MAKIKAALEAVARGLKIQHALRAKAVRRMTARHEEQERAKTQAAAARKKATELRKEATHLPADEQDHKDRLTRKAHRKDQKAERLDAKATAAGHKAIAFKRAAKRKAQQIHKLHVRGDQLEADLKRWEETHGPHVGKDGKVASADSKGEGFVWVNKRIVAECATGKRPTFYSMEGSDFNVTHALLRRDQPHTGQMPGERSDCSLYGTECCLAARLPDPNGQDFKAGYTGTALGQHNGWHIVSEAEMRKRGWGIVIYLRWPGDTVGHHWENYIGEGGDETAGHGSAPIDNGVIDLFGNGLFACLVHD